METISITETMAKPILGLEDMIRVLDLPESTLEIIFADHPPPMFTLGRRRYIKTVDLMPWVDELAGRYPWTKRKNAKRMNVEGRAA
jgi:hypothetical protein